jgi:hypothetical protein
MNGLGLDAFDFGSGAAAWREVTLQIDLGRHHQVDSASPTWATPSWTRR